MFNKLRSLKNRKPEDQLVQSFVDGDEEAFAALYARYQEPILRFVSQKVSDEATAQDLTQEVFLKVHRFRGSYSKEYSFTTWLWTIARNTLTDSFRKRGRGEANEVYAASEENDIIAEIPCERPGAEDLLEQKWRRRSLINLGRKLTKLQRKVLWMRVIYQLPYNEIAKRMNMSMSAVKCLAHRSKQMLNQHGFSPAMV